MGSQKKASKRPKSRDPVRSFEKWFEKQFGALPKTSHKLQRLYAERCELGARLSEISLEIEKQERLKSQWTAALYAKFAANTGFTV